MTTKRKNIIGWLCFGNNTVVTQQHYDNHYLLSFFELINPTIGVDGEDNREEHNTIPL